MPDALFMSTFAGVQHTLPSVVIIVVRIDSEVQRLRIKEHLSGSFVCLRTPTSGTGYSDVQYMGNVELWSIAVVNCSLGEIVARSNETLQF